jgi:dsDNA-specific endonuclease/ATPase MutS2
MKAFGLAALMAKTGIPVPAQSPARLPCFSSILADIGDEQSLTANLSTFSGHLRRRAPRPPLPPAAFRPSRLRLH